MTTTAVIEWETSEGAVYGYNAEGEQIIEISALQNRDEQLRWGQTYMPGRVWFAIRDREIIATGHARDLRVAKRDALAALTNERI